MFLINTFWGFLNFCRIIGFFPCKKLFSEEYNSDILTSCSGLSYILRCAFTMLTFLSLFAISAFVIVKDMGMFSHMIDLIWNSFTGGVTGQLTNFCMSVLPVIHAVVVYTANWTSLSHLVLIQNIFAENMFMMYRTTKTLGIVFTLFILSLILGFVFQLLAFIIATLKIENFEIYECVILYSSMLSFLAIFAMPYIVFFLVYLNITESIMNYIQFIQADLDVRSKSNIFLEKVYGLSIILDSSKKLFTTQIFSAIISGLLGIIVIIYNLLAFYLREESLQLPLEKGLLIFPFIFFVIHHSIILYFVNTRSDNIKDSVMDLRLVLNEIEPIERLISFNGNMISSKMGRNIVMKRLKNFQGFDGLGYFLAGKQLMTGIFANVTTYLIVLVQFQLGESGQSGVDDNLAH